MTFIVTSKILLKMELKQITTHKPTGQRNLGRTVERHNESVTGHTAS
jgi:hypothetical protein